MKPQLHALSAVVLLGLACGGTGSSDEDDGGAGTGGDGGAAGSNAGAGGSSKAGSAGSATAGSGTAGSATSGNGGSTASGSAGSTAGSSSGGGSGSATAGSGTAGSATAGSSGSATAGSGTAGSGTAGSGTAGAGGAFDECAALQTKPEVFGHSAGTLYKLDPDTKQVTMIGPMLGCQTVIDLALDKTGAMYATTSTGFVTVDKTTAKCTAVGLGNYPNSLSFVPAGTLDPAVEALVGYEGSTYVRIDPKTGSVKDVGTLSGGYVSSGDIVSVIGGGTWLTVTGNGCGDCLVQVDPKTGDKIGTPIKLSYGAVYGLAYWEGVVYGFTNGGQLFSVDLVTKATADIPIPMKPAGLSFYGAGSTTCARKGKE